MYVESTWIGKKRTRGNRATPRFPISMWNIHANIVENRPTTNNAVESFNARWNQSIGTNCNVWRVIEKFKTEDSLARAKLEELVTGRNNDSHPSRSNERKLRLDRIRGALTNFDPMYLKEFVFGMRSM